MQAKPWRVVGDYPTEGIYYDGQVSTPEQLGDDDVLFSTPTWLFYLAIVVMSAVLAVSLVGWPVGAR